MVNIHRENPQKQTLPFRLLSFQGRYGVWRPAGVRAASVARWSADSRGRRADDVTHTVGGGQGRGRREELGNGLWTKLSHPDSLLSTITARHGCPWVKQETVVCISASFSNPSLILGSKTSTCEKHCEMHCHSQSPFSAVFKGNSSTEIHIIPSIQRDQANVQAQHAGIIHSSLKHSHRQRKATPQNCYENNSKTMNNVWPCPFRSHVSKMTITALSATGSLPW